MRLKLLFVLLALMLQAPFIFADEEVPTAALTFIVDNADRVEISVMGDALPDIHDGSNTVNVMQWSNVTIAPKSGCIIKSVVNSQGKDLSIENGSVTFMVYEATPETYTITTEMSSEVKFTIDVDDASKVTVVDKNYSPVAIKSGINNLEISSLNLPLMIGSIVYGQELYQVLLNDVEVKPYYGSYVVTPLENSVIKIITQFPDKDCTVSFSYPEGINSFFTCVSVNGTDTSVAGNSLDVKCGDNLALYYNASCWDIYDAPIIVKINGEEAQWFGPGYSFVVKDNTTVEVAQAQAVDMITISLEVDNPANVVVYRVDKDYRDVIVLANGSNIVELPKENANLVITNVQIGEEESKITGVKINDIPKSVPYYNEIELRNLDPEDIVKVYTEGNFGTTQSGPEITVEPADGSSLTSLNSVMFYLEADWDFGYDDLFEVKNEDGIYFALNGIRFCDARTNIDVETIQFVPTGLIYNPGQYQLVIEKGALAWVREDGGDFVTNDEDLIYTYSVEGIATDIAELPFTLDPTPGSTVNSLAWTMTVKEGYNELDVAETMAYIYKDGQQLCGVYAEPSDDYTSVVITPDSEITEDGAYELIFTIGAVYCDGDEYYYNVDPLVFAYDLKTPSSIISIEAQDAEPKGVFNLQGIKVTDSTANLPAGIYIINGKKVVIK